MKKALLVALLTANGCTSGGTGGGVPSGPDDRQPQDMSIQSVNPPLVLPGSLIVVKGTGFVPDTIGQTRIVIRGSLGGATAQVTMGARYISPIRLEAEWPSADAAGLPVQEGIFSGEVKVEADEDDTLTHISDTYGIALDVRASLEPSVSQVGQGVGFVNDEIQLEGAGFLLGGFEGSSVALLEGCFRPGNGATCHPLPPSEVSAAPTGEFDRRHLAFPFAPRIAGIQAGTFEGTLRIANRQGQAAAYVEAQTGVQSLTYELLPTEVTGVSPSLASLGQYVDVQGSGFIGAPAITADPSAGDTTLELEGTFRAEGGTKDSPVAVSLVPEFVSGHLVRYVLDEQDDLGQSMDLRQSAGEFTGTILPVVQYGADTLRGNPTAVQFSIGHVKQVVWLNFLPSYLGSLRHFGLRPVDQRIRDRVLAAARRDYRGLNVEFRLEKPSDFAQYAQVDLSGPDPNGVGLLGYDNTPGKDKDNSRLYDKIGGVNATTQEGGYPGYGGVFVESFFGFSTHPGMLAKGLDGATAVFDQLFDPFRPDVGGEPVRATDLASVEIPVLASGEGCPAIAADRSTQIACAVFALGSMIGTTMTHEVAHSLGLADPYGEEFHNMGDGANRLMDGGQFRTFNERAELAGEGPAVFCDEDFVYLQKILPASEPDPLPARPACW